MELTEYHILSSNEGSHWWFTSLHSLLLDLISNYSKSVSHVELLDAGCGTGGFLYQLAKHNKSIRCLGLDYSAEALKLAKFKTGFPLVRASVEALPVISDGFDIIVSVDVLCQLNVRGDRKAFLDFARALKPGGMLILHLPSRQSVKATHDIRLHTKKRYKLGDLTEFAQESDLTLEFISYRMTFLFPVIFSLRMLQNILAGFFGRSGRSDLRSTSYVVNCPLKGIMGIENYLIKKGVRFPFGSSIIAVYKKGKKNLP